MSRTTLTFFAAGTAILCVGSGADAATTPQFPERKDPPITTQALPPLALNADLIARDAGFADGNVLAFELVNRGKKPVSASIAIDIYVDNVKRENIVVNPLPGDTQRHTRVPLALTYAPTNCGNTRNVGIVIDPQNLVPELYNDNNRLDVAAPRRCPDLAVESIKKNMNQYGTEYVAEIKLINKGDAVVPKFYYLATASNAAIVTPLPNLDEDAKGPLAPGETVKFNIGNAFAHQAMNVMVWLDRRGLVAELNESNNLVEKRLD